MSRTTWLSSIIIVVASLNAAPAIAAPNCTSTSPALDEAVTCTYSAGGTTDITVPTGANYMAFVIKGAGGGGGGAYLSSAVGAAGGIGAEVSATVDISSIDTVRVAIGAGGSGGTGGFIISGRSDGGSGGGFSAIHAGASSAATDVLAVAGGGGGGGGRGSAGTSTKVGGDGAAAYGEAGGDGVSPGYGAPGDGNGGTGGTGEDGDSWAAGGAGGSGTDINSGKGGAGYGGGEEGATSGTSNGSGGGAGGSYVRSALLVGSATYAPTGGAGGNGQAGSSGTDGADGSVTITFSAAPITPPSTTPSTASYVDFSYFLPDGRECTSISPQRVQVGTFVELPGEDALCRTSEGSLVAGWTIPVPAGFTGAGSSSLPLSPGHRVRVIESQRFTVVPFEPMITVEYDANIAADDSCTPANMAFASEDGRMGYAWVPRTDFSSARTWSQAPCVPEGYELIGWNTSGDGTGQSLGLGEPMPESWGSSMVNERRLFAVWQAA